MANDLRLPVRRAIIAYLRTIPGVTALVGPTSIYGPEVPVGPVWPFVQYGFSNAFPDRASCLDGTRIVVSMHCYAHGPGEDAASQVGNAIARALDGAELKTEAGNDFSITWTGGTSLSDPGEPDAWHVTVDLDILASA